MKRLRALVGILLLLIPAGVYADDQSSNIVSGRFDFDPLLLSYVQFSGTHSFSERHAFSGILVAYLQSQTLELDLSWIFTFGKLQLSPGLGVTFGTASWGDSSDKKIYVGRDIGPVFSAYYLGPIIEAEMFNQFWFPVQESSATALTFAWARLWGVLKWHEVGLGPHVEFFLTKEGTATSLYLSDLWVGAHFLANLKGASLQMFFGYDTVALDNYLGAPKVAGPVYRGTFVYTF